VIDHKDSPPQIS
jgi:cell division cycle 20-like protein 1 (cofactor of APC complex)